MHSARRQGLIAVLAGLAMTATAAAGEPRPGIATPSLDVTGGKDSIRATGTWVTRVKRGASSAIAPVNAVTLSCDRRTMLCRENRAEVVPGTEAHGARPASEPARDHLALTNLVFTVTEWSDARVTARSDTPHGDLMLRIVVSEKLVRLSYWDTRAEFKDKDGAASGFVWELQ
jgi:hypothetical protein